MDWSSQYPDFVAEEKGAGAESNQALTPGVPPSVKKLVKNIEVADIGCGFGGLLVGLSQLLPETLILGE